MAKYRCYVILLFLCSAVLSSCAGAPARDPDALFRLYDAPLAPVQEAARQGLQRLNLDIFEDGTGRYYLQGGRHSELTGRSETVMVWFEEAGAGPTTVWIATRKPGWVWGGAFIDWSPKLFDHIQQDIQTRTRG